MLFEKINLATHQISDLVGIKNFSTGNGYKMQIAKNLFLSAIHKFKVKLPLKSSCFPMYFINCGCMLEITLNRDWTEESVAMLRPRCELLLIRLTKISKLLCKAFKNCSSSSSFSPFWYAWKILNYYLWNFKTKTNTIKPSLVTPSMK